MKNVYGYIRVSTVKQGTGVSLQEQKEAIIRYAEKHQLNIIKWFEEQETAAKQGRPLFTQMMKLIKSGKSHGVIIHKIDRSARNLKDWAILGDLMDQGFEIHFAHESLDMDTRGGRLAADIQAVIASDYIRNLRDEAIKGLYGRLKQGIYPFNAPIGYLDAGRGQLKKVDKMQGPLVRKTFELYATGNYSLEQLTEIMKKLGLRNTRGNFLYLTGISKILNNPYYTGVMKIKSKTFQGKHEPLISSKLYSEVQSVLRGKTNTRNIKHQFLFRKLVKCVDCGYSLIGEKQKGHIYYRCQTKGCPTKTIREERIEKFLINSLEQVKLQPLEDKVLNELLEQSQNNWSTTQANIEDSLKLQENKLSQKLGRLTDAYLDNVLNKDQFEEKKEELLIEQQELINKRSHLSNQKEAIFKKAKYFLELINNVKKSYVNSIVEEKRIIINSITSNFGIEGRKLTITMQSPFTEIANRWNFSSGRHERNDPRKCTAEIATMANSLDDQSDVHACISKYDANDNFLQVVEDTPQLRESMKNLLDEILKHFELLPESNDEQEL
ncbi:MAG: recombinase family protein [Saprospiraceae bacterium]|nr:recombinase family protein [Saprospiraceae bacterium]MBK8298750.1 recombinase family protein [Saprospiraceae bacterium]